MDLNKVIIVGRATAVPELRRTPGGLSVTAFGVATNHVSKDKQGNKKELTEFHNIVLWGRQAEIASQFITKGGICLIEGRLQTRQWQDKQGVKRKTTEIVGERLQLGPKSKGSEGSASASRVVTPRYADDDQSQAIDLGQPPAQDNLPVVQTDEEVPSEELPFPFG